MDPERVLTGTWFVTRSSLPLWRVWDEPSVTYAPLPGGTVVDTVRAVRGDRVRLITGLDMPLGDGRYDWRGLTPLTRLAVSLWEVIAADPADVWAVTLFDRTPFTPPGQGVYSRTPRLLPDDEAAALRSVEGHPAARRFWPELFAPRQTW